MKILYFSQYYLPHVGGGTWSTYYLSSGLARRGHEVRLIVANSRYKMSMSQHSSLLEEASNPRVHRTPSLVVPAPLSFFTSIIFFFWTGLKLGRQADAIVSQHHPHHLAAPAAVLLGKLLKIPVVLRADDTLRDTGVGLGLQAELIKLVNLVNEMFLVHSDRLLVVTQESKRRLQKRLRDRLRSDQIQVSPNGVNLGEFDSSSCTKESAMRELGLNEDQKILVAVGHFARSDYGMEVVLKALPIVSRHIPRVVLLTVGDELTCSQQSLVDSLGLRENVKTHGPRPHSQMVKFIIAADVCIGPLYPHVAMPPKILEYMACGKPVVTGFRSVTKEVAAPDLNCVLVPPNPEALAQALVRLLLDDKFQERLALNARSTAQKFTWERTVANLERTLLEMTAGPRV